jgi:predicted dehydrogenase
MISTRLKKIAFSGKRVLSQARTAWMRRKLPKMRLSRLVKVALIGSGKAASYHLHALRLIENLEVTCLVNRGRSNPQELLDEYKIPSHYKSVDDALDARNFEAAIVAISCESTAEVAHTLGARGIRCLIEKPLALSSAEAQKLALLDSSDLHNVAYNRRFYSSTLKAREIVRSLGAPYSMHIEATEDLFKLLKSAGIDDLRHRLITNTTHGLDLFTLFYGKAAETAALFARKELEGVAISFQTGTRFQNGANGTFLSHWQSPGQWLASLFGNGYRVDINLRSNECILQYGKKTTVFAPAVEDRCAKPGVFLQDWTFFDAVAENRPAAKPLCTIGEACATLALAEAILAAVQSSAAGWEKP